MNKYTIVVDITEGHFEEYFADSWDNLKGCLVIRMGNETVFYPLTSILRFSIVEEEANG